MALRAVNKRSVKSAGAVLPSFGFTIFVPAWTFSPRAMISNRITPRLRLQTSPHNSLPRSPVRSPAIKILGRHSSENEWIALETPLGIFSPLAKAFST